MPTPQRSLGDYGESLAADYLSQHGYRIIERKWHCPQGELDLITHDGTEWVFVEVRTRRAPNTNAAIESITPAKQARIITAAQAYLDAHALEEVAWRIDVVVIAMTPAGTHIEVIEHATGW